MNQIYPRAGDLEAVKEAEKKRSSLCIPSSKMLAKTHSKYKAGSRMPHRVCYHLSLKAW